MTFSNRLLSNKGFNTIELMIGVAILAVVALAGATLGQVADRSTQYPDRKQEFQALGQMIMERLKHGESCISALQGQAVDLRSGQERQFAINVAGLQAGPSMSSNVLNPASASPGDRQILPRRLQVNVLSFSNAKLLADDGTNSQFLVSINLQADEIGGISFKKQMIGMTTLVIANASNAIVACESLPANAMKSVCESDSGMGCVWDPNSQPNCRCLRSQVLCAAPGYYPVSFKNGIPNCRPLGGRTCPAGEFLVGVGIDQVICAPVPTSCPSGSSTSGAGNQVPGLAACRCNNAGESWVSGSCSS